MSGLTKNTCDKKPEKKVGEKKLLYKATIAK